jgi:hypothetical protein
MGPRAEGFSAAEAACPEDRVHRLAATGLIRAGQHGLFTYVTRSPQDGLGPAGERPPAETIEGAVAEGLISSTAS